MLFATDPSSPVPIYRQLVDQLRFAVGTGRLEGGEQLPSAREVAADLGINLHTVVKAYQELVREGLLEIRRGRGTFVTGSGKNVKSRSARRILKEPVTKLCRDAMALGLEIEDVLQMVSKTWRRESR